jgi:glutamate carboxypeptidase
MLRVAGTPAHSSQIFRSDIGSGAVFEAARILAAFHDSLRGEPYLTLNPGAIVGGTRARWDPAAARGEAAGKSNVIAESTLVAGDLRTLSIEQRDRARARMRAIVARSLPGARAEIAFHDSYPPMAPSAGNRRLLARYDAASRAVGTGPVAAVDPMLAGAADVSFVAPDVEMALDGVGLMGDGGHTVNETADLRTLASQARRMAVLLARLASDARR